MVDKITKYLGIDWGEKRIGLALGDSESKIATPFEVVPDLAELLAVIGRENIGALVIGAPFSLTGLAPSSKLFDDFLRRLKESSGLPVELVDERLSSKAADALSGNRKTKAPRDALAAMLILQSYLDRL